MAIVESSQPLSIESFSYSWLINLKPSLESLSESFRAAMDSSDESFFIEMDPNMPASKRFKKLDKDFDFNLPFSEQTTAAIVHADELFCDGLLMPLVNSSRNKAYSDSSPCASPLSEFQNRNTASSDRKIRCSSLRRCRSLLSRKMFEKYLNFLFPLLEKLRCCRSKSKIRAADDGIWVKNKSSSFSPQASPRTSVGSFPGDMRRSCDSESSINEAVLHCKKSIDKGNERLRDVCVLPLIPSMYSPFFATIMVQLNVVVLLWDEEKREYSSVRISFLSSIFPL